MLRQTSCLEHNLLWTHTKVGHVFDFLNLLFYKDKAGYNTINSARSALASIVTLDDPKYSIGSHPLI